MPDNIVVLVIDDQIGAIGSSHHRAFLRRHGALPLTFRFSTASRDGMFAVDAAIVDVDNVPEADLVLLDVRFGEEDDRLGLDILQALVARCPSRPVVVFSALERDVSLLGRCLEEGALGVIQKTATAQALGTRDRSAKNHRYG